MLHTGKVLFWSYDPASYYVVSQSNRGVAYLWDPATHTGQSIAPPENIWCGGQTILADGRVYVAGGNLRYPDPHAPSGTTGWQGAFTSYTFNPANNRWVAQPNMSVGRWYPTTTKLVDNRVVITSGFDQTGSNTLTPKVSLFTPHADPNGVGTMSEISPHDPSGFYPFQFVLPDGQMLQAGPGSGNSYLLQPGAWTWNRYPTLLAAHFGYGNGISYTDASGTTLRQTVMLAGGTQGSAVTSDNEYMDGFNPAAGWRKFPNWLHARRNGHTVILADGTLFTMGGNASGADLYDQPVFHAELYARQPTDVGGSWAAAAPHTIQAAYHSSGILLPDGRVLLTSDDLGPAAHNQVQIYSPPYLFKSQRPRITNAPATVAPGQTFTLGTDTGNISAVMLIAPGATTHANDMHQRAVRLRQNGKGSSLSVTLPAQAGLIPPGYYMLFAVDGKGVPSVARFVRVT
ncbi:galactose oxidase precursor [Massilia sp. BSC265]|nr:galactose oxidase precursor [Massilia sp. BSC265]